MKIKKSQSIALWVGAILLVAIACSQTWYTLEMSPDGNSVELKSFDGFATYLFISPFLMLSAASVFTFMFLSRLPRLIIGALSSVFTALLLALVSFRVASADVSSLSREIEAATGIAATHGLDQIDTSVTSSAYWAIASIVLLLAIQTAATISSLTWPKKKARTELSISSEAESSDTISIWDSQR